jgi:hypothetical protein
MILPSHIDVSDSMNEDVAHGSSSRIRSGVKSGLARFTLPSRMSTMMLLHFSVLMICDCTLLKKINKRKESGYDFISQYFSK